MTKFILASNSPRRQEIFRKLNIEFEVITSDIEEIIDNNIPPYRLACDLAYQKASSIITHIQGDAIIIAADTIVYNNGVFGKPHNHQAAYEMIKSLSGKTHEVITGLAIIDTNTNKEVKEYEITKVHFRKIEDEEIYKYIATGEPMDKAGGYGIQGKASLFIRKIDGDYYNVVGLPVYKLGEILKNKFDISLL